MTIHLSKFGAVLSSRTTGKEAYAAFLPTLSSVKESDEIIVDFDGVSVFSPSWGDEFLTPLKKKFGDRLILKNVINPSVVLTISTLERMNGDKFEIG